MVYLPEAHLLGLIWKHIVRHFVKTGRARSTTHSVFTIAPREGNRNGASLSSRITVHVEQRIADAVVLYRFSNAGTSWVPIDPDTCLRDAIGRENQELQTFEFEFGRHGSEFKKGDQECGE